MAVEHIHTYMVHPGKRSDEVPQITSDAKRRLAFTSAQGWGADRVFDELFRQCELNS